MREVDYISFQKGCKQKKFPFAENDRLYAIPFSVRADCVNAHVRLQNDPLDSAIE